MPDSNPHAAPFGLKQADVRRCSESTIGAEI
jgi:hypothetical protein